jgi:hypothetical protein
MRYTGVKIYTLIDADRNSAHYFPAQMCPPFPKRGFTRAAAAERILFTQIFPAGKDIYHFITTHWFPNIAPAAKNLVAPAARINKVHKVHKVHAETFQKLCPLCSFCADFS